MSAHDGTAAADPGSRRTRVARGARLLVVAQLIKTALQILSLVVLSRLLSPQDFGYVAVGIALMGVGEVIRDAGLSTAAVTARELSHQQRSNLFWLSSVLGLVLCLLLAAGAPAIGDLFSNPKLASVVPLLSTVLLFGGIGAQYRADLNRQLRFASLAKIDVGAAVLGVAVAITGALLGLGYWAIVLQPVVSAAATCAGVVAAGHWAPLRPRRRSGTKGLVIFGVHVSMSQIIGYAGNNVDTLILGYYSTASQLGFYNRAFQLVMQPLNQIKTPATTVALPLLSRSADDPARLTRQAAAAQRILGYTILPVALALCASSQAVVDLALGSEWSSIGPIVSLLAIAGACQQMAAVGGWALTARGRGSDLVAFSLVSLLVKTASILVFVGSGAQGVAFGYLVGVAITWPVLLLWTSVRLHVQLRAMIAALTRPLIVGAIACGSALYVATLFEATPVIELAGSLSIFAVVYVSLALSTRAGRREVQEVLQTVGARRSRKSPARS